MIKLLGLTVAALLLIADGVKSQANVCDNLYTIVGWTRWFDRDDPSGSGDWETLSDLRQENLGQICDKPVDIEARTLSGDKPEDKIFKYDTNSGFICRNIDQPGGNCKDYKVRFACPPNSCPGNLCWTKYYNRDRPSATGDWESLTELRRENPGQICDNPDFIQAVTVESDTPAIYTGQKFLRYNPSDGFVCRNEDQPSGNCQDYKVRFACPC